EVEVVVVGQQWNLYKRRWTTFKEGWIEFMIA
ncbi:hypothetical protein CFOL_v3_34973, partial [Cephalotus follicularis]